MGKASVLVVDDEHKISDVARTYLERDGSAVCVAMTGQEALKAAQRLGWGAGPHDARPRR